MGKTISCSVLLGLVSCFCLQFGTALDTVTPSKSIKDPEFIISQNGIFRLGFFSLANSSNRYVGILYHQIPVQTVVWVANRNRPLKDSSGILNISDDGNLVVLNGKTEILWSSNVTNTAPNATTAQLSDLGNLVLSNGDDAGSSLWESFQHPCNVFLQTMKIGVEIKTGRKVELKSWKSIDDPSDGNFSLGFEHFNIPELVIRKDNQLYFRTGPWNGNIFIGIVYMYTVNFDGFDVVADNPQQPYYITYEYSNDFRLIYYELDSQGKFIERRWDADKGNWINRYPSHESDCDVYGICGAFGICDSSKRPICSCLKGFKPRNAEEWSRGNWSSGCFRNTPLQCQRDNNNGSGAGQGDDEFLEMQMMKVPTFLYRSLIVNGDCKDECMKNCSCVAYAYDDGIGCMLWSGDLVDVKKLSSLGVDLYIRLPSSELDKGKSRKVTVITTAIAGIVVITISALFLWCRMAKNKGGNKKQKEVKHQICSENIGENSIGVKLQQLPIFNFEELATATNNFNHAEKLGQGGFGPVYKGTLDDGKEIAVKRLSKASVQGLEEFMNEMAVISKLQHRNLVRLFGCCVEGEEKMLVYEYMPNKSLDAFLFDPAKKDVLGWRKRFNIIEGISRGLLYLHRDSRLKIIHRDLKASNILLDEELNPKISDFGMARIFGGNENQANTKRVVGTYGYMSPEYVMRGQFSEKSDVFSFGVLLLEVVSGRRSTSFYNDQYGFSLLGYAWKLWREGDICGIVDEVILESETYSKNENEKEIWRCIHVGLLCVQEFAKDRPTMPTIVSMLNSEISDLNTPKQPAFTEAPLLSHDDEDRASFNDVTLTNLDGR
ncbi:G-type lectin S-receptor-like serine/threonine-protein kinase At1g11330 isoform X1 [Gossypium arboreum]|uniref:G-type lectin S-receptor-like serine/threonine-protein kinase At1g11330 isoform X1 n=1 Tax=Gossypium arboreum TaxID=29729 RepID=UPI0008195D8F|nr:G-type lectin S-receptor-like serine/threonine-protein kinase At1g11330 isoform X1 [Gossypium arboreum]